MKDSKPDRPRGRGRGMFHGGNIEAPKNVKRAFGRLMQYFGAKKILFIIVAVFILISVILRVLAPAIIGNAIKQYLELTQNLEAFVGQMILLICIYLAAWLTSAASGIIMVKIATSIIFRMRNQAFAHIQTLSMAYFDKRGIGDIISRLSNDIEMIYNASINGFINLLNSVFTIIGILVAIFILSFELSLILIGTIPLMMIAAGVIGKRVRQAYRKNQAQIGVLSTNIQESVTGIKAIKAFFREKQEFEKFRLINSTSRDLETKAEFTSYIFMPVMLMITSITLALIIGIGGTLVTLYKGIFSIGLITSFIIYTQNFFQPLRQITHVYNVMQSALAGAERIFEVLDAKPDISTVPNPINKAIDGTVEFKEVSFGYEENKPVLENINFKAHRGEVVAIVGPTGAGKTTLVNLLCRFYDVWQGKILIDGINLKDFDVANIRKQMGVVLQEPYFFATSIKENLLYGNPSAQEYDIKRAVTLANAEHFISKLPATYETVLSERGLNLSQGERQLLAIARAILANPRILILDEAMSNIDSLTETHIQQGLLELMKNRTSFIIAHRLSTIKNANNVLVVHNKKIIEQGTHKQLMSNKGFYYRLYKAQLEKPEITEEMAV